MPLTGDQTVALFQTLPPLVGSLVALAAAVKAERRADAAQKSAEQAHVKAAEAAESAQQQINFALDRAVRVAQIAERGVAKIRELNQQAQQAAQKETEAQRA